MTCKSDRSNRHPSKAVSASPSMKILYSYAPCLEPGRDGVEDYVRLLAGRRARAGHSFRASFAQRRVRQRTPHVSDSVRSPLSGVECVASWTQTQQLGRAHCSRRKSIRRQVFSRLGELANRGPTAFTPKGLFRQEDAERSAVLGKNRGVHVLLHELWIGLSRGEWIKNRGWGVLQRRALTRG